MIDRQMSRLTELFFSMIKIGCIGFGGGNALIPVIQKSIVEEKKMIDLGEYEEDVVVASITPGALPVEISGGIGKRVAGWRGMIIGAIGMALPGVFLTVFLLSIMSNLNATILRQIGFLTIGITTFIASLLTDYITGTLKKVHSLHESWKDIAIIGGVFVLTCGKNLYRLLGITSIPVFGIATIHVFIMTFFVIFFMVYKKSWLRYVAGSVICIIYILCVGQRQYIQSTLVYNLIRIIMVILAVYGIKEQLSYENRGKSLRIRETVAEIVSLAILSLIVLIPACLLVENAPTYFVNGFLSSLISFGGGDAYLTVADGLFVNTSLITDDMFYGSVVPLVNVLPGSILCKTLSGVGFYIGYAESGNIGVAYIVALAGFVCSIVASCGIFSIVSCVYNGFDNMEMFQLLKRWIRPIVSGLMLTVILSLVYQNYKFGKSEGFGCVPVFLMIGIYVISVFLNHQKKMKNGKIIVISVIIALIGCNALANCM